MQKNSNSDYDGQPWQNVSLQIGETGLDLRQDTKIGGLTSLLNARFADDRTVVRRTGYTARRLQDRDDFPPGMGEITDTWLYGHGNVAITSFGNHDHYPISNQHLATFRYGDSDVSWTGDRLLVHAADDSRCVGSSNYWRFSSLPFAGTAQVPNGIPCYLPSLTDFAPPIKVTGTSNVNTYDMVMSPTRKCVITSFISGGNTFAQIIDRETNQILSNTQLNIGTSANTFPRVVYSNNLFVAYWRDTTTNQLYTNTFNGNAWTGQVSLFTVNAFDIFAVADNGAYTLVYRDAAVIKARKYVGATVQSAPFAVDKIVDTTGSTPSGPVAVSLDPAGNIGVAWYSTTGYWAREYSSQLNVKSGYPLHQIDTSTDSTDGVSITSSGLPRGDAFMWTVYAGYFGGTSPGVRIRSFRLATMDLVNQRKFNCSLASRAFTVGEESFAWMRSGNSAVYFLVAGVANPRVCGFADRGEAGVSLHGNVGLTSVAADPLNPYKFTWIRGVTSISNQANHARYSEIDFLPQITTSQYGNSVYLSGSAVQNFDGFECSDAGFQDLPIVTGGVASAGGSLQLGSFSIRVYAVRYNNKGEKFISPALTSAFVPATAGQKITWTIQTMQSCTAQDVSLEIYRNLSDGTTYRLEAVIANDMSQPTVTHISTGNDASIFSNPGDPYQPQLGGLAERMENGPIGCTILMTYNDRLWCAGGQVPVGQLVFSKLKTGLQGAGFDALTGSLTVDSEGGVVTSLAGMNDQIVALEREKVFVIQDQGPDNFGRGSFPAARFAAAKGAITHFGTKLTDMGLVYWNEGGPHLLTGQLNVQNISDAVRPLASQLIPTGVRLNPQQQEVVWFTSNGAALLWDYKGNVGRWAQWSGLFVNGASDTALAISNGTLFVDNMEVYNDGGQSYVFSGKTAQLRSEAILQGYTLLRQYGLVGQFEGAHTLELRLYYNGSPMWEEDEVWEPAADTYLQLAEDFANLTAAQVDALGTLDKSGNYSFHRRAKRQNCQRFQVEFLDNGPDGPSFAPQTIELELGVRPGYGRGHVSTYTDK